MSQVDQDLVLPTGIQMPGGFEQFETASVDEAIALAQRFRAAGRYRYFRGQRDARWAVTSSFERADEAAREAANREIDEFVQWVSSAPDLVPYLRDEDMMIAAAQHHQITPTTYIDFTLEPAVAGWFATDGAIVGDVGAIYLVDPAEVDDLFEGISRSGTALRFKHLDVPNLWRLQAQSGLFLEAHCQLAPIWPFDRIVFPQAGADPSIDRRLIYPDRRSHLEQMIDNYKLQRRRELNMRDTIEAARRGGAAFISLRHPLEGRMPHFNRNRLDTGWSKGPDERWAMIDLESEPPTWTIEEIAGEGQRLQDCIAQRRASTDLLRLKREGLDDRAQQDLDRLWEGMRPHPYSADQIAAAVQSLVRFGATFEGFPLDEGRSLEPQAALLMDDPVELEMGIAGGGATRAFVASKDLLEAMDPGPRSRLGLGGAVSGKALMGALGRFYGASLDLFNPEALVGLFAQTIVPWQVVVQRRPTCFSPVNLVTIGRP